MNFFKSCLKQLICLVSVLMISFSAWAEDLNRLLSDISGITIVKQLDSKDQVEKRLCTIDQQIDWSDPEHGSFEQYFVIKHRGFDKPTVLVTEGYTAEYALDPEYQEELAVLLDANLICVQHRYFAESVPSPCNWDYLTVENSAGDYHHIREALGGIYPGKWFTTGISKGGQTTLFYRSIYPDDVDGSVAYVAPLNKSLEDGRHQPFLKNISNEKAKAAILTFQRQALLRREGIQPLFEDYCSKMGYTFKVPMDEIYDLMVLEYEFAFWQWGNDWKKIPDSSASDETFCKALIYACEPNYFSPDSPYTSFNVQAMREIGYYGYDIEPLKDLLTIDHAEGYMRRVMIPDSLEYIEFDTNLYENVNDFLREEDVPMIFIYGENDPWSATGVTWLTGKRHMHVFIDPEGSHLARIATMPEKTQQQIMKILHKWNRR